MKLQKPLSRKAEKVEYVKWVLVIPHVIEELKWKEGRKLEVEIKENKLVVKKS